jgi:Ran GTPase-activating protein (RanGAP) involved in mRNA processing and transport
MVSTYKKSTGYDLLLQCAEELGCEAPEYFNLASRTDEGVDRWLDLNMSLEALGLEEGDSVHFKIKYYKQPAYKLDDVSLQLFFVQTKHSILSGNFIIPERISLLLAAFQLQIFYGNYDPTASWLPGLASNLEEFLPSDHLSTAQSDQWASRIIHYYQYLYDLTANEATYGYLAVARRVPACGAFLFPVLQGKLHVTIGIVEDGIIFFKDDKKSMFEFFSFDDLLAWANVDGGVALRLQKRTSEDSNDYFQIRVNYDCSDDQSLTIIDLLEGYNLLLSRQSQERQQMLISDGLRPVASPASYLAPARRVQDEPFGSKLDHFLNSYRHTCNLEHVTSFAPLLELVDKLDFPGGISELDLSSSGLDSANSVALMHAVEQSQRYKSSIGGDRNIAYNFELSHINVSHNKVAPAFASIASFATSLAILNLSSNSFSKDDCTSLPNAFKNVTSLVELYLAENEMSDKLVLALIPHFTKCTGLQVLDLSTNAIKGVPVCSELGKMVKSLPNFHKLLLHHNKISDSGLEALFASLESQPPSPTTSSTPASSSSHSRSYHFDFRTTGISSRGLTAVAAFIKNHRSVSVLKLAGNALSSSSVLVEALKDDVNLLVLDVGDAGLGKKGWAELFSCLAKQSQSSRFESSGGLDKHGWSGLRMFMRDVTSRVSHLEFENCVISSQAIASLNDVLSHTACFVTSLNLKGAQFGKKDFSALYDTLSNAPTLMYLNLSSSKLDNAAASVLASILKINTSLVSINLDHNSFTDVAVAELAESLHSNSSLEHISLTHNMLTVECIMYWSNCVSANCVLQTVDLRRNGITLDIPTLALLHSVPCTADILI